MSILEILEMIFGLAIGTVLFLLLFSIDDTHSRKNK